MMLFFKKKCKLFVLALIVSCSAETDSKDIKEVSNIAKITLDKLNSWDSEELSLLEEYEGGDFKPSGETYAWVDVHKGSLEKIGYKIRWNKETKLYVIVK